CLLPFHYCFKSRAHRHFRFAITDVAAEQTIHGSCFFHVALYVFDRSLLVRSQHVLKSVFKLTLPGSLGREREASNQFPFSVEPQQFVSHIAHGALGFRFRLLPAEAAQSIKRRLMAFSARGPL